MKYERPPNKVLVAPYFNAVMVTHWGLVVELHGGETVVGRTESYWIVSMFNYISSVW